MSSRILRWISHRNVQLVGAHGGWDESPTRPHVFFDVFTMFVQLPSAMCRSIRVSDAGRTWGRSQRAALSTSIHTLEGWCSSFLPSHCAGGVHLCRQLEDVVRVFESLAAAPRVLLCFSRCALGRVLLRLERSSDGTIPLCRSADAELTRCGPGKNFKGGKILRQIWI